MYPKKWHQKEFKEPTVFWEEIIQTTWLVSWETCIQVRKQQLELDMEEQTGSK